MRIEKVSDKQIRCTLTQDDLDTRNINISELAYGTEKARSLFREMLTQASRELDFDAENMPLMIEAVPVSGDGIVLFITKVDDPDELDTRFSKFAPAIDDEMQKDTYDDAFSDTAADDVIEDYKQMCLDQEIDSDEHKTCAEAPDLCYVYNFRSIDDICNASKALMGTYDDDNSLYKDPSSGSYYLVIHKGSHAVATFNKICNTLCEYGTILRNTGASYAYCEEHMQPILKNHALQALELL